MERLTKVDDQGRLLAYSVSDTGLPAIIMSGNPYRELTERLKAYEDTGLAPTEILTDAQLAEIACMQIRYKKMQELLERAAEEIENCYGTETELSAAIRTQLD